jgi:hypothetical protein
MRSPAGLASWQPQAAEVAAPALAALGRKDEARARLDAILSRLAEVSGNQHAEMRSTRGLRAEIAGR